MCCLTNQAPHTTARSAIIPGTDSRRPAAELALRWLVAMRKFSIPLCPFDVASTVGSTTILAPSCVIVVVANVAVEAGCTALSAVVVKKTTATAGAGTLMEHT